MTVEQKFLTTTVTPQSPPEKGLFLTQPEPPQPLEPQKAFVKPTSEQPEPTLLYLPNEVITPLSLEESLKEVGNLLKQEFELPFLTALVILRLDSYFEAQKREIKTLSCGLLATGMVEKNYYLYQTGQLSLEEIIQTSYVQALGTINTAKDQYTQPKEPKKRKVKLLNSLKEFLLPEELLPHELWCQRQRKRAVCNC